MTTATCRSCGVPMHVVMGRALCLSGSCPVDVRFGRPMSECGALMEVRRGASAPRAQGWCIWLWHPNYEPTDAAMSTSWDALRADPARFASRHWYANHAGAPGWNRDNAQLRHRSIMGGLRRVLPAVHEGAP